MPFRYFALLLGTCLTLGFVSLPPAAAQDVSAAQKKQFEAVIKDYLLKNPEVVREALVELDRREKEAETQARLKITTDMSGPLYTSPSNVIVGNPKGDVTLVEFFDYNCGYCKKGMPDLQKLVDTDKNVRIVLRDMPILSPGSVEASKIAIALKSQLSPEKFWEFHVKLMTARGTIGEAQALAAARDVGADIDRLSKDVKKPEVIAALEETGKLTEALNITATPTYVLGSEVMIGTADYADLKTRVDSIRKCGKSTCG